MLKTLEEKGVIEPVSESGRSKTYRLSKLGQEKLQEFRKRGDLKHKARLGRMVWLQLLEPHERAQFLLTGMHVSGEVVLEIMSELNKRDKERLTKKLTDLKRIIQELETSLSAGGS
jgi:DNA-binding PadR family transcriptional regulator